MGKCREKNYCSHFKVDNTMQCVVKQCFNHCRLPRMTVYINESKTCCTFYPFIVRSVVYAVEFLQNNLVPVINYITILMW